MEDWSAFQVRYCLLLSDADATTASEDFDQERAAS